MKNYKQIWYWLIAIITVAVAIGTVTGIVLSPLISKILAYVGLVIAVVALVWAVKELLGTIFEDDWDNDK
jgi:hypothetical protein